MLLINLDRPPSTARKQFKALQAAGLTIKPSKVQFGPREGKYLGHILTADGIRIGEDRIKAIVDLPTPKTIKQLRSVLGMVNFVRKFIRAKRVSN